MAAPFITAQELSDYLGRDVTADDGATFAVSAACDMARALAGQEFTEVIGDTITLDGSDTDALIPPQFPLNAAGTVLVDSGTITDYNVDTENGILFRDGGVWPEGRQNVEVTYDHGYGTAVFPRDVKMVALQTAARIIVQGVALSEQVGETRIRYASAAIDFTSGERMILAKYRRTR